jgi:hypothetical protein
MAWQYPLSATDPLKTIDLSTTDNVYIAQQVAITSGDTGIRGTGSGHHAIIEGSVAGSYGILLGTDAAAAGHVLEISETGKVFSGDTYAALLYGASNTVDNAGLMKSGGIALYMSASSTTGFSTITNSGSITAASYGLLLTVCTQEIRINNTGTIKGAWAVYGGIGVDKIANSGTMVGGIDLRAGDVSTMAVRVRFRASSMAAKVAINCTPATRPTSFTAMPARTRCLAAAARTSFMAAPMRIRSSSRRQASPA